MNARELAGLWIILNGHAGDKDAWVPSARVCTESARAKINRDVDARAKEHGFASGEAWVEYVVGGVLA